VSDEVRIPRGRRAEDVDLAGVRLHGANFDGVVVTDGWFPDTELFGDVSGLRVNGVEVAPLVDAELDRRHPERVVLRATEPAGLLEAWGITTSTWTPLVARAKALSEADAHERVNEEWSFVETLRHLVFATDCWCARMLHGQAPPYHPWGLAGSFLSNPAALGLDVAADPSLDEVLAVRAERLELVRSTIAATTPASLAELRTPPDDVGHPSTPHTTLECLHVVLNEEWEHAQYASRDLAVLEARSPGR
jgi:hypothetical protein